MLDLSKLPFAKANIAVVNQNKRYLTIRGANNQKVWKIRKFVPSLETAEMMGLWFGDGDKTRAIGLSNNRLQLVINFLEWTNKLGLPRELYLAEVVTTDQNILNVTKVAKKLKVDASRIRIRTSQLARETNYHVRLFSRILARLFGLLANQFAVTSVSNKKHFIKGLLAAESCIKLRSDGVIHGVYITVDDEGKRAWIKENFLEAIGLKTNRDNRNSIYITGFKNFSLLNSFDAFSLHPQKRANFVKGFGLLSDSSHAKTFQCISV